MNGNGPYVVYLVVAAVFVASSLFGRRLALGTTLRMALAWIGIFILVFAIFAYRDEFTNVFQRLRAEATGTPMVSGETVRIPIADDGHFWVRAELNGHPVRFMVDSGASVTTVSASVARGAGLKVSGAKAVVSTANGQVVVDMARADTVQVGSIVREGLRIHVTDVDTVNVLGMNFLSSLSRWSVEGSYLVLVS